MSASKRGELTISNAKAHCYTIVGFMFKIHLKNDLIMFKHGYGTEMAAIAAANKTAKFYGIDISEQSHQNGKGISKKR